MDVRIGFRVKNYPLDMILGHIRDINFFLKIRNTTALLPKKVILISQKLMRNLERSSLIAQLGIIFNTADLFPELVTLVCTPHKIATDIAPVLRNIADESTDQLAQLNAEFDRSNQFMAYVCNPFGLASYSGANKSFLK